MNMRKVGARVVTQKAGVVTEAEVVGRASEWLSVFEPTYDVSLPATTPAPPERLQPFAALSKSPPGARKYQFGSPRLSSEGEAVGSEHVPAALAVVARPPAIAATAAKATSVISRKCFRCVVVIVSFSLDGI